MWWGLGQRPHISQAFSWGGSLLKPSGNPESIQREQFHCQLCVDMTRLFHGKFTSDSQGIHENRPWVNTQKTPGWNHKENPQMTDMMTSVDQSGEK